jgi:hypothetical protein
MKLFYEFERRKELVVVLIGRGVLFYYELTPSAMRRDGDDAILIFRAAGAWDV